MLFISLSKHAHLWWKKTLLSISLSPSSTEMLGFSTSVFSPCLSLPSSLPVLLWTLKFGPNVVFFRAVWTSGLKSGTSVNNGPKLSLYYSDQSPNLIQNLLYLPVLIANMSLSQKPHPKLFKVCNTTACTEKAESVLQCSDAGEWNFALAAQQLGWKTIKQEHFYLLWHWPRAIHDFFLCCENGTNPINSK